MTIGLGFGVVGVVAMTLFPTLASASGTDSQSKGRRVFESKQCIRCHVPGGRSGGGPPLEELRRPQGAWELTGRLWNHVPAMFTALAASDIKWPRFTTEEVTDLMTFLAATTDADQKPDLARGQTLLVQKGCLKCHALRGEGGRIGQDLSERTAAFASPAAWAVRVWAHAPNMATEAKERGIPYPRFSDREMVHLIAYLKSVGVTSESR